MHRHSMLCVLVTFFICHYDCFFSVDFINGLPLMNSLYIQSIDILPLHVDVCLALMSLLMSTCFVSVQMSPDFPGCCSDAMD